MRIANFAIKMAHTKSTFQVQRGVAQGHVTQFRNFGTLITSKGRDIRLKFGTYIEDGSSLRTDHKTNPKWVWSESRDLISKFWDSLNNF